MNDRYLMDCRCGQRLPVEARQAGESLRCRCGIAIRVPPLRELRRLPRAQGGHQPAPRTWSPIERITFVAGAVVSVAALGVFTYLLVQRLQLEIPASNYDHFLAAKDLRSVTPEESWMAWRVYRTYDVRWGHSQSYQDAHQRGRDLNLYMAISGGLALVTAGVIPIALFFLKPGRSSGEPPDRSE